MPDVAVYRPPQTAEEALAAMRKTRGSHTSIAHEIERAEALEARLAEPDESAEPDELAEPAEPTLEELRARVEAAGGTCHAPPAYQPLWAATDRTSSVAVVACGP